MIRRIIHIDEKNATAAVHAAACHEGAIGMVNGKATLLRDDYCDGLGDCLPTCPTDAITFVEREAAAYDEAAVKANMAAKALTQELPCGCPGSAAKALHPQAVSESKQEMPSQLETGRFKSSWHRREPDILTAQIFS